MEENIFQPLEEYYNRLKNQDNEVENAIKSFMAKHDITTYKMYMKGGKRFVDVVGNVMMDRSDVQDGTIPFPFGKVSGSFSCNDCNLTSLENSPLEVGDYFYCSGNNLESLAGAPKKVGIRFECAGNRKKDFTSKDINKASKIGHKVKIFPLTPTITMWNGDGNYPTKVEVDKYRITTYDNVGIVIAIHVSADYYDKSQNASMMNVSFWTEYNTTPFDSKMMRLDRVNGLEDYFSPELCEYLNNFFTQNINVLVEGMDLSDIDLYNYDIPASRRSLLEDGYSDLWTMIADSYSHYDRMWEFIGDDWLDGAPLLDLKVFDAFSKSKA